MIDEACSKHNVHESHYGNILIALTEAVNNAIHHGNALDPTKTVTLGYEVKGDKIDLPGTGPRSGLRFRAPAGPYRPTEPREAARPWRFLMRALGG